MRIRGVLLYLIWKQLLQIILFNRRKLYLIDKSPALFELSFHRAQANSTKKQTNEAVKSRCSPFRLVLVSESPSLRPVSINLSVPSEQHRHVSHFSFGESDTDSVDNAIHASSRKRYCKFPKRCFLSEANNGW